ncbi:MAG: Rrf2 family transcriptional regulator [Desulfopila sp.]|jgi:Rrf2 family protein|nr:Rrf2 family transcriptional regulator [Desulfopila sp.]
MPASTKLSNSVKALCFLARNSSTPQSSATISSSTGVNASKLRRLLADLAEIGVVTTTKGASGGYVLAREPENIHLQEIYCAIEDRKAFHLDVTSMTLGQSDDTSAINHYFLDLFAEIQIEIEEKMRNLTLESILERISQKD